jgi:hypothetical protein
MEAIATLILGHQLPVGNAAVGRFAVATGKLFHFRLFSSGDKLDVRFLVSLSSADPSQLVPASALLENSFSSSRTIIDATFHTHIHIQNKGERFLTEPEDFPVDCLRARFLADGATGYLYLDRAFLSEFARLIGVADVSASVELPELIAAVNRTLYRVVSMPPDDMPAHVAAMNDKQFQWLLNRFLQKGVVTPAMLASTARLWDIAARVLDNLPAAAREEVREWIQSDKRAGTWKRAKAVAAIASRNIQVMAREGNLSIPGLASLEAVRDACDNVIIRDLLNMKSLSSWIGDIRESGRLDEFFRTSPRRPLVAALSTLEPDEVKALLSGTISADGLRLLAQDTLQCRRWPERERQRAIFDGLRIVRTFYFTPLAERAELDRIIDYTGATADAMDLVADWVGFGTVIWALRASGPEEREKVLSPVLAGLYEGLVTGDLTINGYQESSIPKYRMEVTRALMVLKEEGRF